MRHVLHAGSGTGRPLASLIIASLRHAMLVLAGLCLTAGLALGTAAAHEFKAGTLTIGHPWTRATPPSAKVGGGFMSITNNGTSPDRLVAVECEAAGVAEIHHMATENGVMKMQAVPGGLEIAPGATVKLAPGGYHVMFMELKQPFTQGSSIKGTLVFEKAGRVPVSFKVEAIASKAPDAHHDHGGKMHGGKTQ
jgi:copper(I)-binding protein